MKYLKSFKIFESSSEAATPLFKPHLVDIIKDIFIQLDDFGIEYNIEDLKNIGLIQIEISGQNEKIDDCVNHLENYLKDLGYEYFYKRSIGGFCTLLDIYLP